MNPSIRSGAFLCFLMSLGMLFVSLFFELYLKLDPCPLCVIQRLIVMVLASFFFLTFIHAPKAWGRRAYGGLLTITSVSGVAVAARQCWLQGFSTEKVSDCSASLGFWIKNLPVNKVIEKLYLGSGECSDVSWTLMGFSLPELSFFAFILFLIYSLKLFLFAR